MDQQHTHETGFTSESLVQARVCQTCGSYVSGRLLQKHVDFHESLKQETLDSSEQLELFPS